MNYQKTFAFDAKSTPPINAQFWLQLIAVIQNSWGDASKKAVEASYESGKINAIKFVIEAKSITHLGQCCYDLAQYIGDFKIKHRNYKFYNVALPGAMEEDEKVNDKRSK